MGFNLPLGYSLKLEMTLVTTMIKSITLTFLLLLVSCAEDPIQSGNAAGNDYQKTLQEQLITAKPGDVITIPKGVHAITRGLSLKIDGVTIKGAGMDKSILSFKDQIQGSEGLMITASNITLADFAVEDTVGDAIKINECENLIIDGVRTEWTNGPDTDNGAYGLYPVQCRNVLIENSVAIAASDAGIYVGQSDQVIVRRSRAEYNVAGIEIENTTNADVYDNIATNNTGGVLVFNMPNLPKPGFGTRVFNNQIFANNTENFAPAGGAVAGVPAGSGVLINSNDQVEIFENDIRDNNTANIIISSFFATTYTDRSAQPDFDPYPEAIYIYDNQFSGGGSSPDGMELKALKLAMYGLNGSFPDIIWDGIANEDLLVDGALPADKAICIEGESVVLLNVDMGRDFANVTDDMSNHRCSLPKLPAVQLALSRTE